MPDSASGVIGGATPRIGFIRLDMSHSAAIHSSKIEEPSALQRLSNLYSSYQQTLDVRNGDSEEHARLPHFNGNKTQPIHGWFTYKEGFSSDLLTWVCKEQGVSLDSVKRILDPFAGVGTSLLSAQINYRGKHTLELFGIERNPFAAFVGRTKLNWQTYNQRAIARLIPKLTAGIRKRGGLKFEIPDLSTLKNQNVFNRRRLQDLLFAREVIREELKGRPETAFFELGWSSIIEIVSNVRKDGRALRFVEKEARPGVYQLLRTKWTQMLNDIRTASRSLGLAKRGPVMTRIYEGDGRTLESLDNSNSQFDLIVYSPPYLNHLDYSEVYKLELWLSGAIQSQEEFRKLRLNTLRSHPSVKFPETFLVDSLSQRQWPRVLREALIDVVPPDRRRNERVRTIRAYMDDMLLALRNQFNFLIPGGLAICVVGNSVHGSKEQPIPIATDLLIASLAEVAGFQVERLQVTRYTRRRDYNERVLREGILTLRRPKTG